MYLTACYTATIIQRKWQTNEIWIWSVGGMIMTGQKSNVR